MAATIPNPFPDAPAPVPVIRNRVDLPPPDPKPAPARLTILSTVYHQPPEGNPACTESRTSRDLLSDEQPYERHTRVGPEWTPLNTEWVRDPGFLAIRNDGTGFRVNPTLTQREEAAAKVVEIGLRVNSTGCSLCPPCGPYLVPFARLRPGESLAFDPVDAANVVIRCMSGTTPVTICAYPR